MIVPASWQRQTVADSPLLVQAHRPDFTNSDRASPVLECGDVIHYRAYSVGEHGHFVWAVDLVCPDDEAAIESAKLLVDRYDIEVWQGGRKVIRLVPQKRPHTWPRWRKM